MDTNVFLEEMSDDLREVCDNNISEIVETHLNQFGYLYEGRPIEQVKKNMYFHHNGFIELEFVRGKLDREMDEDEMDLVLKFIYENILNELR